jgi:hypothetical protein
VEQFEKENDLNRQVRQIRQERRKDLTQRRGEEKKDAEKGVNAKTRRRKDARRRL